MMVEIPANIDDLVSYKPGKAVEKIKRDFGLKEIAVLWNGENNLGPSPKAVEAMSATLQKSHKYPDPSCFELRTKLANYNNCSPENIFVGNGSEELLSNTIKAFCQPGDEILTSSGTFVAIYIWSKLHNVPLNTVGLKPDYSIDLNGILNAITTKTKVIYLANPNNPTGSYINHDELNSFVQQIPKNIIVVVDEAYFEYAQFMYADFPDSSRLNSSNVITLRTFSKTMGIAGVRIGYGIAVPELADAMMKVKMTFAPSSISQAAAIGAIEDAEFLNKTISLNRTSLEYFYSSLEEMNVPFRKSAGNFVMVYFESEEKAEDITNALMKKGVLVRWLKAFGIPNAIRIGTGNIQENELFVSSLKEILT